MWFCAGMVSQPEPTGTCFKTVRLTSIRHGPKWTMFVSVGFGLLQFSYPIQNERNPMMLSQEQ